MKTAPTTDRGREPPPAGSPVKELPKPLANRPGYLLARTHREAHARAEKALEPMGLGEGVVDCSPRHVGCLLVIGEHGPLSQQRLGELIDVDRTTIVAVVDWLESQGLVERKRNPVDRRAYALQITPKGRRWVDGAERALRSAEREFLKPLSAAERERLVALLQRLALQ